MATDAPMDKVYFYEEYKTAQTLRPNNEKYRYKSSIISPRDTSVSAWRKIEKASWVKPPQEDKLGHYHILKIGTEIELQIPQINRELESVFIEAEYILNLKDNWDDEGSVGYTIESWRSAANFIINYNRWLRGIFSGSLHLPKMHHGPNGTIDVIWHEDNFRLFVNIDKANNKGSFYSDTPKKQYTEGEFLLDDFKFQMLPLPFKY